jgi:hypothetical protein
MSTKKTTYTVDKAFIKEAYAAAPSEWKERLMGMFPSAFEPTKEIVTFPQGFEVATHNNSSHPLVLSNDLRLPDADRYQSLFLREGYEAEIVDHNGRQFIRFFKVS